MNYEFSLNNIYTIVSTSLQVLNQLGYIIVRMYIYSLIYSISYQLAHEQHRTISIFPS